MPPPSNTHTHKINKSGFTLQVFYILYKAKLMVNDWPASKQKEQNLLTSISRGHRLSNIHIENEPG